jgi:flavin reductase (DIM6/NTAB) family NADH-FMN oxidoreductase RutF
MHGTMGAMEHRADTPPAEFDVPAPDAGSGVPEILETGFGPDSDPALEFRRTLGMFATGVTVITTQMDGQAHGMTVNAFMSVSLQPPLVLISIDHRTRMNKLLRDGVPFGISVLADTQALLSDHYGGRRRDETVEPSFESVRGTPLVEGALAHLVARVVRSYWGGDHTLFLGQVEYVRYGEGEPLLFHGGRYERLVRDPRLFSALSQEILASLLAAGTERTFVDGDVLMRMGEQGDSLYVVLEGTVLVRRSGRTLRVSAGELIGEIEVLSQGGRIADVIAEGPVRCLEVSRHDLLEALEAQPKAAVALIELLASRFREQR